MEESDRAGSKASIWRGAADVTLMKIHLLLADLIC